MISKIGKKIFFINPPNSLKTSFLEYIFKNEFELYLLENSDKVELLLNHFSDVILFINIDRGKDHIHWIEYIKDLHQRYKNITIGVFSSKDQSSLRKTLLMDIGISGGYILLAEDNWKTIELIRNVLEFNEARGRRKSVRLDFDKNEKRDNIVTRIFTRKGYLLNGIILSFSSAGVLLRFNSGKIDDDDNIDRVIFKLGERALQISGSLLKQFENGNVFITFENISENDKEYVQSYIFNHLQHSFKRLLERL